jgi:hypothetical protein
VAAYPPCEEGGKDRQRPTLANVLHHSPVKQENDEVIPGATFLPPFDSRFPPLPAPPASLQDEWFAPVGRVFCPC